MSIGIRILSHPLWITHNPPGMASDGIMGLVHLLFDFHQTVVISPLMVGNQGSSSGKFARHLKSINLSVAPLWKGGSGAGCYGPTTGPRFSPPPIGRYDFSV